MHAYRFIETMDGGFAVTGWTAQFDTSSLHEIIESTDTYVMRTDSNGRMRWITELKLDTTYGDIPTEIYPVNDYPTGIVQQVDGSIVVIGIRNHTQGTIFLTKIMDRVSDVTPLPRTSSARQIRIVPNPTLSTFMVDGLGDRQVRRIDVFDVLGRLVVSGRDNILNNPVDISALRSGAYRAQILLSDGSHAWCAVNVCR